MGNIILDEVKNGGKEARQVVQQDTGELRDFFKRKVRAWVHSALRSVIDPIVCVLHMLHRPLRLISCVPCAICCRWARRRRSTWCTQSLGSW